MYDIAIRFVAIHTRARKHIIHTHKHDIIPPPTPFLPLKNFKIKWQLIIIITISTYEDTRES